MDIEAFIRDCASRGWSKHMTYNALGMNYAKFDTILDAMNPPVVFVKGCKSIEVRAARARIGNFPPKLRAALQKANEARKAQSPTYTIGSTTGRRVDLYELWREYIDVSDSTVARRIKAGVPLLDAFFMSRQKDCTGHAKVL